MHSGGRPSVAKRLLRLGIGVVMLVLAFAALAHGPLLPGAAGRILLHNRELDLQAGALFYTDLERMPDIQSRLERMRAGREGAAEGF